MPAARGVKRTASKSSALTTASAPKSKKKRGAIQLEVPTAPQKRGEVLTCGQGDVGQLGLGEDVMETTKFKVVTALGNRIVDVCAGGMHTVALDYDGKVWTFGCNDEGALGRVTSADADEMSPDTVTLPEQATRISAGDSHSAALLVNGDVYAWGAFRDSHGSMGLVMRGREGKPSKEPIKIDIGEIAVGIASGSDHLVILSTSGSVYTMGCGEQGQLGRLSQRSASRDARQGFSALLVPSKVTLKSGAVNIWAGYHATVALAGDGERVFAWGLNNYSQLGITGEKRKTAIYTPTECDAFAAVTGPWRSVACGQHHSLALTEHGQVYAVGRCEYGRLGLGDRVGDAEALEPVPALQQHKCVHISAGTCNSFAVTDKGELYAWGMGSEGQLGTGGNTDAPAPRRVPACGGRGEPGDVPRRVPAPARVAAGAQHTVLLQIDPNAVIEPEPEPEKETEEENVEEMEVEEEKAKPKGKKRGNKRKNKNEQEEEVTSTSAQEEAKPEKVNGDEKETPMEVDESDNKKETNVTKTDEKQETKTDPEPAETKTKPETEAAAESKPETTDTSSQDSQATTESDSKTDSDAKTDDSKTNDSKTDNTKTDKEVSIEKKELNGSKESEKIEAKSVEGILNSAAPITTTA